MTASLQRVFHEATSRNARPATGFGAAIPSIRGRRHQASILRQFARFRTLFAILAIPTLILPAARAANQFVPVAALNFSKTLNGDNPLSQVITITSTGTPINFTATVSTDLGGSWLAITPSYYGSGLATPFNITVSANPAITLAAGQYTGSVTVAASGVPSMTIPVTLDIHNPTDSYFDQIAGGLTFSMVTSGSAPPGQALQVRSATATAIGWTAAASTSDTGSWLKISSSSGTSPSNLTVSIDPTSLPGAGGTGGNFTGEVLFTSTSSTDIVSVPITVNVGSNVLQQVNPLNFNKVFAGPNPLAQVITVASTTSTAINIVAAVGSSTGVPTSGTGANVPWLTVTPSYYGSGLATPFNITVAVNPIVTLAAGTYMAEVLVTQAGSLGQLLTIPVTLTIYPSSSSTYFDNVAGALNFSTVTSGEAPPGQDIQIRNAGGGSLSWTAVATTDDGGNWLSLSGSSGTGTGDLTVSVDPANVPGAGLTAGTFVGQIVLQSASSRLTIPVSYAVGASVFRQIGPLNFTMVQGGAHPLAQVINVASTGSVIHFLASVVSSTGVPTSGTGAGTPWLTINPSYYGSGLPTPWAIEASVNPAVTLTAGTYTAEILVESNDDHQQMSIPVTLTIAPPTATFFDATPGQMTFSMLAGGTAPPAQVLPIRNAGQGSLDWTAAAQTADGGNWLSISSDNGTAPSEPTVSVNPSNVPGGGLVAGTFTGQILLEESGQEISVPVVFTIGANVFRQINPLNFTMTQGGANPLPQVFTAASTGSAIYFTAVTASSTGGSWLSINPSYYGSGIPTPVAIQAFVTASPTMTAGIYSSEVILVSSDGTQSVAVPVTLTVEPKAATFFDTLPGQVTFSMITNGAAPPAQPLPIRNAGAGTLAWTASVSTADGGSWLSISATSGTAPSFPQLSVNPANIPSAGLVAGTFTGQVVLEVSGDRMTIPVTFTVGDSVFRQINGLSFNKRYQGSNPLPQMISVNSTGSAVYFTATVASSTGTPTTGTNAGKPWVTINPSYYGSGIATTKQIVVSLNPDVTLPAGTYTSEIILESSGFNESMVIPVTLTVGAPTATFFDDLPGALTFGEVTGAGSGPASQSFTLRNAGVGALNWTATASTADGGNWLHLSSSAGTAPSTVTVSVNPANLPNQALIAGSFSGQIVLTTGTDKATIPVAMVVATSVLQPVAPISFSKPFGGANPGNKSFNVLSTNSDLYVIGQAASGNGGNWLGSVPSYFGSGIRTPVGMQASASPAVTLVPNTYFGEILFWTSAGDQGLMVPVTLNVVSVPAATPVISRKSGFYVGVQHVTLSDATKGWTIYYSLNGKSPSTGSTLYKAGSTITIPVSEKIEAIAYATGYLPSAVASASYTIIANPPTITPSKGVFISEAKITITDVMHGAEIYYTTNGKPASKKTTHYTKPFTLTKNETIMAVAYAPGVNESAQTKATISIEAAKPKLSKPTGIYSAAITVTITDATKGAKIFYAINGKPTAKSTPYKTPIVVKKTETLEAIALAPGGDVGPIVSAKYTIKTK